MDLIPLFNLIKFKDNACFTKYYRITIHFLHTMHLHFSSKGLHNQLNFFTKSILERDGVKLNV